MKRKIYIIIISILCIAADCNLQKEPLAVYMPQDFKDYVVYPQGSYWVYEDSASGDIDSLYLLDYKITIAKREDFSKNFYYEKMIQKFYCSKYPGHNTVAYNAVAFYESGIRGYGYGHYYGMGYFFDISSTGQTYSLGGEYYATFDSLKILNAWYKDVICIKGVEPNEFDIIKDAYYYWVKYIGIVKRDFKANDSTVWLLKSYFLNN